MPSEAEIRKIIYQAIKDHLIIHVQVSPDLKDKDRVQILCDEAAKNIMKLINDD